MNAVLGSILENLKVINIVTEPTVEVFKGDKTNTSNSREVTVKEFIERYLPSDFNVKKQTKIYSKLSSSNNIDCVVLAPNHPQLITPVREIALAEGVYAAIEVKPDISVLTNGSELMRGLTQIKSVKSLERTVEQIDLSKLLKIAPQPEYFKKIPAVIFSFKSTSIENTITFIISKIKDGTLKSDELPDIIVTLDKGIIFYTPHLSSTAIGQQIPPEQRNVYGERVFIHFETNKQELILAAFLLFFLNFSPPAILTHSFIIKDYLTQAPMEFQSKIYSVELDKQRAAEMIIQKLFEKIPKNNDA
jgi:hypothetical protein